MRETKTTNKTALLTLSNSFKSTSKSKTKQISLYKQAQTREIKTLLQLLCKQVRQLDSKETTHKCPRQYNSWLELARRVRPFQKSRIDRLHSKIVAQCYSQIGASSLKSRTVLNQEMEFQQARSSNKVA